MIRNDDSNYSWASVSDLESESNLIELELANEVLTEQEIDFQITKYLPFHTKAHAL